jgi:hypothetical protein
MRERSTEFFFPNRRKFETYFLAKSEKA